MNLPAEQDLQKAWTELRELHREFLAVHGVIIPDVEYYADNTKAVWLAVLWHFEEREVHKMRFPQWSAVI